jgi:hypothetical protein
MATTYYLYDPTTNHFLCTHQPLMNADPPIHATTVPPLPRKPQMVSLWDASESKWVYQEHFPAPGEKDIMEDLLTYDQLRAMEYPPMANYVDGIVKQDMEQVQAYQDECMAVKARWPKTMEPITRREYYQQTLNMRPLPQKE